MTANSKTENSTNDFQVLASWLNNITVSSGGNCTESAMIGIRKGKFVRLKTYQTIFLDGEEIWIGKIDIAGIEISNNNSKIYIMTDARKTNASLKKEVIDGLKAKNLIPIYILTGNCSRQSRDDVYGKKAGFFSLFIFVCFSISIIILCTLNFRIIFVLCSDNSYLFD